MSSDSILFKVHYKGKFDRSNGCVYVGGNVSLHSDPYNLDCQSFIEIEDVVKEYGYKSSDLVFYQEPMKSLSNGLRIIYGDPDVLEMGATHVGKDVVVLYVVRFETTPEEDPVDGVDDDTVRCIGIGTGLKLSLGSRCT